MKVLRIATLLAFAAAPLAAGTAETKPALPFIENDYGKALSRARAKKLPIFADAWAPW